jgi:hypothetical protein
VARTKISMPGWSSARWICRLAPAAARDYIDFASIARVTLALSPQRQTG